MEDLKKKMSADMNDKEIVFSKSIKAGKRIYYLDVKKNRKDEMFLAITESKKVITGEGDDSQVSFEKHKIFLYREDFQKFMAGLEEAVNFIECSDANEYIARLNTDSFWRHTGLSNTILKPNVHSYYDISLSYKIIAARSDDLCCYWSYFLRPDRIVLFQRKSGLQGLLCIHV